MDKEKSILNYMEKLHISREEAEQLYNDDLADYIGEDGEQMQEKAKAVKNYTQGEKPKRKNSKERKIDTEKLEILKRIKCLLEGFGYSVELEKEVALHFKMNGSEYSLKLIKHREPKS